MLRVHAIIPISLSCLPTLAHAVECSDSAYEIHVVDYLSDASPSTAYCVAIYDDQRYEFEADWSDSGPSELLDLRGIYLQRLPGEVIAPKPDGPSVKPPPLDDFGLSAIWHIYLPEGQYRFFAGADDGIFLRLDGVTLIDEWRQQSYSEFSRETYVSEGIHEFHVEYFEATGLARIKFGWDKLQ